MQWGSKKRTQLEMFGVGGRIVQFQVSSTQTKGVHQVNFKTNGEMGKRKRREKEEMHTIKIKYLFNYLQAAANENHKRVVCLAVEHPESPAQ